MNIREKINSSITYFDGAMGTVLLEKGLKTGEFGELWNIEHPNEIVEIHREYLNAGCDIISANTFGANCLKFNNYSQIVKCALENAQRARDGQKNKFIALDIGPLGKILKPFGDMDFCDAVNTFAKTIKAAHGEGADLILIETMNDCLETKAAVIAAKENSNLPIFVTNVYDESGKLMTGANAAAMISMLESLGVDAIGMNCSLGPGQMLNNMSAFEKYASVPIIAMPNAGLPKYKDNKTIYDVTSDGFAAAMKKFIKRGACILGGCCGTTPEYIKKTVEATKGMSFSEPEFKTHTTVSSYTHIAEIGKYPVLIGERINPTGKSKFKQALRDNNIDYILNEAVNQQQNGAHILDVNVGLPEIDEKKVLTDAVVEIQAICNLPLQIDTADTEAMESAMRIYAGKPLVNSVNGKAESMKSVFPLVKKYGGAVIALTLDEKGIPETAYGRFEIAQRIINEALEYGIPKKDIIIDPLAMTVSSDSKSAAVTLEAIRLIKNKLGACVSLGVSNISFGLPKRGIINSVFFAQALYAGLDCAIMNVMSSDMMKTYYSHMALKGYDTNLKNYVEYVSGFEDDKNDRNNKKDTNNKNDKNDGNDRNNRNNKNNKNNAENSTLEFAIKKGLKEKAYTLCVEMLKSCDPMQIITEHIVPALNETGDEFEQKKLFLPQLLMSAEAAQSAFSAVRDKMLEQNTAVSNGKKIILATVKGDIHDIGKNIVKVLLLNFGYDVADLGKDVPPEEIVDYAKKNNIKLVGLSALMTTTVKSMEETIRMLKQQIGDVTVVVGGAVLTQEYADMIGADCYARDAMSTVRFVQKYYKDE